MAVHGNRGGCADFFAAAIIDPADFLSDLKAFKYDVAKSVRKLHTQMIQGRGRPGLHNSKARAVFKTPVDIFRPIHRALQRKMKNVFEI